MSESIPIEHTRESTVQFFTAYTRHKENALKNKIVVDLSAGTGYIAHLFEEAGAVVYPYDLFPNQNKYAQTNTQKIDLQKEFPIATESADLVICAETIEHLPNQLFLFREVSRILKSGGIFLLTTPNTSSLRSRFAQFMMESEHYSHPAPNELDAFVDWGNGDGYFGKLFLSGILRLRTLAALHQLQLKQTYKSSFSSTSIFFLFLYPLIWFFNWKVKQKQIKNDNTNKDTYNEIFQVNTSLKTLLSKHLIMEFRKK